MGPDHLRDFDEVVIATGVLPRDPEIPGQDHPSVLGYVDVLRHGADVGGKVAVIGAGGIGFDTSEFLVTDDSPTDNLEVWLAEWGIEDPAKARGGLDPDGPDPSEPARQVWLLQRKNERPGKRLGKTTGWIHRAGLKMRGVQMVGGVSYERIDDDGLHVTIDDQPQVLDVDTIVLCAGQVPLRDLADSLTADGIPCHVIGGADVAAELDAKRAIDQGTRLAATL